MQTRNSHFERVTDKLLAKVPKAEKYGAFVEGRFVRGTRSTHRNAWAIRWWKMLNLKTMHVLGASNDFHLRTDQ